MTEAVIETMMIPITDAAAPINFPGTDSGTTSPYPTVVDVITDHHIPYNEINYFFLHDLREIIIISECIKRSNYYSD